LASTQSSTRSRRQGLNGTAAEEAELATELPLSGVVETESMEVDETPKEITQERLGSFKKSLSHAFQENRTQTLSLARVKEFVNKDNASPYSQSEIEAAIDKMSEDNQVMMADGIVFLI